LGPHGFVFRVLGQLGGRPRRLPSLLARASPARTRSAIIARSNSANTPICNLSMLARICDDHVNLEPHEFRCDLGRTVVTAFRPPHIDFYVAPFYPPKSAEPRQKGGAPHVGSRRRASAQETNSGEARHMLRARRERPRGCCAA